MKRIFSFICASLCAFSVSADAAEISYSKNFDTAVITVKEAETDSKMIMAKYKDDNLETVNAYTITSKDEWKSDHIIILNGYDYKFFVWDSLDNMNPLIYTSLILNMQSPDDDKGGRDGEYTGRY